MTREEAEKLATEQAAKYHGVSIATFIAIPEYVIQAIIEAYVRGQQKEVCEDQQRPDNMYHITNHY